MWKQLLAYALAFCMAFEAPATVYAAEQNGLTNLVNPATDLTDITWGGVTSEGSDSENESLEETDENETDLVEDEVGEGGDSDADVSDRQESDSEETETDQDAALEESEPETTENGDQSDENADEGVDTVSDMLEAEPFVGADTAVVPPPGVGDWNVIDPKFAFNSHGMDLVAPLESSNEKIWYSFTVPEDGEYLFYTYHIPSSLTENAEVDKSIPIGVNVFLYRDENYEQYDFDKFEIGDKADDYLTILSGNMKKDDVIFLTMTSSNVEENVSFPLRIMKLPETSLIEPEWAEDGSSCTVVDTKEGYSNRIVITPQANSASLTIDAEVRSGNAADDDSEYTIDINYRKVDDTYYEAEAGFPVSKDRNYSKTISVDAGSTYILYYTVRNDEGEVIACFSGNALETLTVKATYHADLSADFRNLTLSADVSNYTGNATYAYLSYQYEDALGRKIEEKNKWISISNLGDVIHLECVLAKAGAFLGKSSYNIKMWLSFPQDSLTLGAGTVTLETPEAMYSAGDVNFSVEDNTDGTGATCKVTVNGAAPTVNSSIFYRPQGWPGYEQAVYSANRSEYPIASLQPGITYEFVLFIGGIKAETTWKNESAAGYLSLEKDTTGVNKEGAYDLVRTLKVKPNGDIELSGTYYLHLTYFTEGMKDYSSVSKGVELSADDNNEYQATVYSAQMLNNFLCPDKDYYIIWALDRNSDSGNVANAVCTLYEKVHTQKDNMIVRSSESTHNSQTFAVTLDEDDVVNMKMYNQTLALCGYIKKSDEDEDAYRRNGSTSLASYNDYSGTIRLTDLEAETSYDLSLRDDGGRFVYKTLSFKTPKDNRKLEITSVSAKLTSVTIDYSVTGVTSGYLYLFLTEKGQDHWEQKDYKYLPSSYYSPLKVSGLTEDTTYEYIVGIGDYNITSVSDLQLTVTGEFTTQKDQRALSNAEAIVTPSSVLLKAFFGGNIEKSTSYIQFFYREKNVEDRNWTANSYVQTSAFSQSCSATLTGLARNVEYEYAIVLSDQDDFSDPDSVTKEGWKVIGTFKTTPTTVPTKITLSQEKFYLNAAYPNIDGSGRKQLRVSYTPDNATQGLVWESSDPTVASVSGGLVSAAGSGTTTITVKSAYAEEVYATCDVVVGNYKIGYTTEGSETPAWRSSLSLYQGKSIGNYNLYRMDENGAEVLLSASQFHVETTNKQVVTWENGVVTAHNVGSADLTFVVSDGEKDSVCAYLPVSVSAQGKGFDILDFTGSDTNYPAIKEDAAADGNAQYTLAYTTGISYTAKVEISPLETYSARNFDWKITDKDGNETAAVATVSPSGVVTPASAGTVYLTVTATKEDTLYYEKTRTVVLNFKALPEQAAGTSIYALANISSKIGDVAFPAGSDEEVSLWKDWSWKYPATPLVTNGVNRESYPFEAVYSGDEYYPCETTLNVFIAKVTGVSVFDDSNKVVEIASLSKDGAPADSMVLTISTVRQGTLNTSAYPEYKVYGLDGINGLTITQIGTEAENAAGTYRYQITAETKGTYTLKPEIRVAYTDRSGGSKTKTLAKSTYKIKAVDSLQAASIELTSVTDEVAIEKIDGQDGVVIDITEKKASDIDPFTLNAVVKDRYGDELNTALTWKTTDSSVAAVKAETGNTHAAKVTVKGEGHAILTAVAKDDTGCEKALRIEIRNRKPRVNVSKATVNLAYDYNSSNGMAFAKASSGAVEIVPVYGESIQSVSIYEGKAVSTQFRVTKDGSYQWVVGYSSTALPAKKTYNCTLRVTTSGGTYEYPFKVSVVEKKPKVTAKAANTVNLFYTNEQAWIDLKISGTYISYIVPNVSWHDNSSTDGNGFAYAYSSSVGSTVNSVQWRYHFNQEAIELTSNKKLADPNIAKGTLTVRLYGYKDAYEIKNLSIKWKYKKPSIVSQSSSTTLIPSAGMNRNRFGMYNKTEKKDMSYSSSTDTSTYNCYYAQMMCKNENVTVTPSGYYVNYVYNGSKSKGSEKINMTLLASYWREPVNVTHTIKFASPTAYLTASTVTVNTTKMGTVYSYVRLKNAYNSNLSCDDIVIEGKDSKSKELLEKGLLELKPYSSYITIKQNRASTLALTEEGASIKNGTYTYKVTPYYTDSNGNRKALKTLTLKIKATDKAVTAKTKTSGSLDLIQQSTVTYNYIKLTPVFSNLGSGYTVTGAELCGEYSNYFSLSRSGYAYDYLRIAAGSKLKSGQKYKLAVKYTIAMSSGDTFTVMGADFTVKPKQTAPKVTIGNNNQVIYAAADVSRTYNLSLPASAYTISNISGSLDCNKDGIDDITVTPDTLGNSYCNLTVRVADPDGLKAVSSAKGKTYSIPITVRLQGADGVSKDVKTSIKVTVKR